MDGRPAKRQRRSIHSENPIPRIQQSQSPPIDLVSSSPSSSSSASLAITSRSKPKSTTNSKPCKPRTSQVQLPSQSLSRVHSSSVSPRKSKPKPKPKTQGQGQGQAKQDSDSPTKSKSLHTFFQPATEAQRWSAQKFEPRRPLAASAENTLDADIIEDDYDSYDEIFSQHFSVGFGVGTGAKAGLGPGAGAVDGRPARSTYGGGTESPSSIQIESPVAHGAGGGKSKRVVPKKKKTTATTTTATAGAPSKSMSKTHASKRFLMPVEDGLGSGVGGARQRSVSVPASVSKSGDGSVLGEVDTRPWAQRFAPSGLDEIAVHKRKVSDVQRWLEDVFAGRRKDTSFLHWWVNTANARFYKRLLVLRGPAGSGKTTTVTLLSETVGFDLIEWRNPSVPEYAAQEFVSVSTHFEEFLGRGDRFGGLHLEDPVESKKNQDAKPRSHRVLLIEEFPTVLSRNSSSLAAFRASLQRYLAASTEPSSLSGWMHPPIVMIVSETMLSSASSISDNLTVHRLLGPTLYNHQGTTIIDFNIIAPTFMQKALRLVLEKEASTSQRSRIPGAAVLEKIAEIGDIRSALSALEFLCLKDDKTGSWSGTLTKSKKARRGSALTPMERESLEMISQREASLGMFHAVGKIAYNKRLDPSLLPAGTVVPPSPPDHLSHHSRVKVSEVAVNDLLDETGTDVSTFISALHENYPPSCHGHAFTDSFNACIEALSDADILSADRKPSHGSRTGVGIGATMFNAGIDMLRQDEISFQVASRGLLFGLPYPVNRKVTSINGRKPSRIAHQMLYPASLRLWRRSEEIEGLLDSCLKQMLDSASGSRHLSRGSSDSGGVKSWRNLRLGFGGSGLEKDSEGGGIPALVTMMPRLDALLYQLPYMAQIRRKEPDGWSLAQITGISSNGTDLQGGNMDEAEDDHEVELAPGLPRSIGAANVVVAKSAPSAAEEEKLILSDDDIVDD
ncbi:hypothetical protein N7539_004451 [Penicillium diatomitis]|uniref:Checkpoint protein RAD24-like helical bundle domain-containing protein n=1 Tax=Penicillium diatomitis TaxID=2819901 RepID=A0A9W9XDY1_9EURO|nr:uncharacterized protein N7539_004451 [Penicillium diatomitis]KAJ5489561.1 hypothetical protein N7539_004451 [Penicillium diatomitis]